LLKSAQTLKVKLAGVVGFCIVSIAGILLLSFMELLQVERDFKIMKQEALDGQMASLAITRDVNYISRLTRNIMLGSDIEKDLGKLNARIAAIKSNFDVLEASATSQKERQLMRQARSAALGFVEDGRRFARELRDLPKAERYTKYPDYGRSATPLAQKSRRHFGTLVKQKDELYKASVAAYDAQLREARRTVVLVGSVVTGFIVVLSVLLLRAVLGPLRQATAYTERIAVGDYDAAVDGSALQGEVGDMVKALQHMAENLKVSMAEAREQADKAREQAESARRAQEEADAGRQRVTALLGEVTTAAQHATGISAQIGRESSELSEQMQGINSGASLQRDRVQETATAMEEMNATVAEVASNAARAVEEADIARSKAREGADIVHEVVEATAEVNSQVDSMQIAFEDLGRRVEEIGQIMNVITDIADQTNLLALNAAIEAARAGDAGRGFAVVADEVRKLAEKTMQATKEVGGSVTGIQAGANSNMAAMEKVAEAVSRSSDLTHNAGQALGQIVDIVSETADHIQSIATAADQQASASESITRSTTEVNRVANETSENVNQSVESIANVAQLAEDLNTLMAQLEQRREAGA
jgi:methyl-accepting chemotaxis protein